MNSISEHELPESDVVLKKQKLLIKQMLQKQRIIVQEYESNMDTSTPDQHTSTSTNRNEEIAWYQKQYQVMQELQTRLYSLRLQGGAYVVYKTSKFRASSTLSKIIKGVSPFPSAHVFKISISGEMELFDHSKYFCKAEDANEANGRLHIDQLQSIRIIKAQDSSKEQLKLSSDSEFEVVFDDSLNEQLASYNGYMVLKQPCPEARIVKMIFKDNSRHYFVVPEAKEFVEVCGAQLRNFNHKRVQTINSIKQLYKLKTQEVDVNNLSPLGISLLRRLWASAFKETLTPNPPKDDFQLQKNEIWKSIGFQSDRPATDFRGMGLLGLWLLVYMAERSEGIPFPQLIKDKGIEKPKYFKKQDYFTRFGWVQKMAVDSQKSFLGSKQYPWAAAGINIASMIIHNMLKVDDFLVRSNAADPVWESDLLVFLSYLEFNVVEKQEEIDVIFSKTSVDSIITSKWKHSSGLEEFFVFVMELLDRMYSKTQATYMDFPRIIRQVEATMRSLLAEQEFEFEMDLIRSKSAGDLSSAGSSTISLSSLKHEFKQKIGSAGISLDRKRATSMTDLWSKLDQEFPIGIDE